MTWCYSLYDFIVQSEIPLLAPLASPNNATNPVTISYGTVSPEGLVNPIHEGFTWQTSKTAFWLNVPSVARFLVSNGQSIVIEPVKDIDEDSVRAFLFAVCMDVLLRQRGLTVLPGYALQLSDIGISFLGGSGLGQSMLQGLLYKRSYSFLSGHIVALNDRGDMLPGIAQLECLPSVVSTLKLENQVLGTLRPNIKKYVIPLKEQYHTSPLRAKMMYTIKMHQRPDVLFTELHRDKKLSFLQQLLAPSGLPKPELFHTISIICIQLPMAELKLQQLADRIEQDVFERGLSYA